MAASWPSVCPAHSLATAVVIRFSIPIVYNAPAEKDSLPLLRLTALPVLGCWAAGQGRMSMITRCQCKIRSSECSCKKFETRES
eukprot:SAG31_NODE_18232_length_642_cov_1.611418_1_plen_84_part_00